MSVTRLGWEANFSFCRGCPGRQEGETGSSGKDSGAWNKTEARYASLPGLKSIQGDLIRDSFSNPTPQLPGLALQGRAGQGALRKQAGCDPEWTAHLEMQKALSWWNRDRVPSSILEPPRRNNPKQYC